MSRRRMTQRFFIDAQGNDRRQYGNCTYGGGTAGTAADIVRRTCRRGSVFLLFLLALLFFCGSLSWAKGNIKGNLDNEELNFIYHTFIPILIRSNICVRADGDCLHYHIICASHDSLSCDVYGIADEKVIKEIFLAMLHSGLNVSSFTFWRSKYHETSLFEKPLLQFIDRTGSK